MASESGSAADREHLLQREVGQGLPDAVTWAREHVEPIETAIRQFYERQELDRQVMAQMGSDRLVLLRAAEAMSAAWNEFIEDDDMDAAVGGIAALRAAIREVTDGAS
ncbi:MAG: hypothetical protein SHS37scaffold145_49 [Phage 71_18]|nr:MAG: hypothetical protein SHS37scaffold145_49 [Phage 71_18]